MVDDTRTTPEFGATGAGETDPLPFDLLLGVAAIADELGCTRRRAQWLHTAGLIPSFKWGGRVCARRRRLREHVARLEQEAQAS